jgi:hypothetical protein
LRNSQEADLIHSHPYLFLSSEENNDEVIEDNLLDDGNVTPEEEDEGEELIGDDMERYGQASAIDSSAVF